MGLFDSVKKLTKPLGKASVITRLVDPLNLSGADQSGIVSDVLLGKKSGGYDADAIAGQIRNAQSQGIDTATKGLGELNSALSTPADKIIREQAARESKGVLSSAQDARRRAQALIAQRGLAGSSLGLSSDRSINQQAGRDLASINARLPGQIRNQQISDAQMRMGAGQGLFGGLGGAGGVAFHGQEGSRSGGLLGIASSLAPLAGTVAGAYFGGPAGAAVGGQIGGSMGGGLARTGMKPDKFGGTTGYSRDYMNSPDYFAS